MKGKGIRLNKFKRNRVRNGILTLLRRFQRPPNFLRGTVADEQVGTGWALRLALALFQMAQRVDAEAKLTGEFLPGHAELCPDPANIDWNRNGHAVFGFPRLALRIGDGIFQAATDAVCNCAHVSRLHRWARP